MNYDVLGISYEEVLEVKTYLTNQGFFLMDAGFHGDIYVEEYFDKRGSIMHIFYKKGIGRTKRFKNVSIFRLSCNSQKLKLNKEALRYTDYDFNIKVHNCKTQYEFEKVMKDYIDKISAGNIQSFLNEKTMSILTNACVSVGYDGCMITFTYITYTYTVNAFQTDFLKVLTYKNDLVREA